MPGLRGWLAFDDGKKAATAGVDPLNSEGHGEDVEIGLGEGGAVGGKLDEEGVAAEE